jgi:hypothetical protein
MPETDEASAQIARLRDLAAAAGLRHPWGLT